MIQILLPWIFLLLPLPWLLRRLLPPAPPSGDAPLYAPFALDLGVESAAADTGARKGLRWTIACLIWFLLLLAASRPQWLGDAVELEESGRSLMLAVDVSGSMEIPDLDKSGANRLTVVKELAGDFISHRVGDRVGLILFGSQAYVQSPLSFDRVTTDILLKEAMIGIAGKQTAIGDAIGLAIKRLREHDEEKKAVLVLLTDGANIGGKVPPKQAADLAAQAGLRIHTIGVGADRMRVQGFFGSQEVNPSRDLDETTLKYIAETTGGLYFRAKDSKELEEIYQQLDQLEPIAAGSRVIRPVTALFPWPLGAALVLSLLWSLASLLGVKINHHETTVIQ